MDHGFPQLRVRRDELAHRHGTRLERPGRWRGVGHERGEVDAGRVLARAVALGREGRRRGREVAVVLEQRVHRERRVALVRLER